MKERYESTIWFWLWSWKNTSGPFFEKEDAPDLSISFPLCEIKRCLESGFRLSGNLMI